MSKSQNLCFTLLEEVTALAKLSLIDVSINILANSLKYLNIYRKPQMKTTFLTNIYIFRTLIIRTFSNFYFTSFSRLPGSSVFCVVPYAGLISPNLISQYFWIMMHYGRVTRTRLTIIIPQPLTRPRCQTQAGRHIRVRVCVHTRGFANSIVAVIKMEKKEKRDWV